MPVHVWCSGLCWSREVEAVSLRGTPGRQRESGDKFDTDSQDRRERETRRQEKPREARTKFTKEEGREPRPKADRRTEGIQAWEAEWQ